MPHATTPAELGIPTTFGLPRRTDWRIGIIGLGGISRSHIPAYRAAGWQVAAAAEIDPARRERAHTELGIERVYDDYHDLVADESVEVISLLTHPTLREPAVAAAAEAGKPLLTEKPLGATLDACERVAALAERAGIPVAVSQNYRWHPACFFARHIIARGLIGAPFFAAIDIFGTQDVDLARHPFYATCHDFLTIQWNTHLADLLRCWMGADARRVLARSARMTGQNFAADNLLISVADFGDGATGHVVHSELLRSSMTGNRCRVDGDQGSLVFDLWGTGLRLQSTQLGDETLTLDLAGIDLPSSFAGPMGDLLVSIEEGREPQVSARRNLATMRHVLAEHRSAQAGGVWIDLEAS